MLLWNIKFEFTEETPHMNLLTLENICNVNNTIACKILRMVATKHPSF